MYNNKQDQLLHELYANHPGVCKIYFAQCDLVLSTPTLKSLFMKSDNVRELLSRSLIEFRGEGNWLDLSNDFNLRGVYSYDDKANAQGEYTQYKLTIPIPHDDFETRGKVFNALKNRQHLAFIILKDGSCRLLGTVERGCDIDRKFSSGETTKGVSKNDITFYWESAVNAFYFKNPFKDEIYLVHNSLTYDCGSETELGVVVSNLPSGTLQLTAQYYDETTDSWKDINTVPQNVSVNGYTDLGLFNFTYKQGYIYNTRIIDKAQGIISNTYTSYPTEYCS